MTIGLCFNTNTNNKLAPCGALSFLEGYEMHDHKFLNRHQALDFTAAGTASYTSGASNGYEHFKCLWVLVRVRVMVRIMVRVMVRVRVRLGLGLGLGIGLDLG